MPIALEVLRAHVMDDVSEDVTLRLHTGEPGAGHDQNLVPTNVVPPTTVPGGSGWTLHPTLARVTAAANPVFGVAGAAANGVSHVSLAKPGGAPLATRALAAPMDVEIGASVILDAATIVIEYTSVDE